MRTRRRRPREGLQCTGPATCWRMVDLEGIPWPLARRKALDVAVPKLCSHWVERIYCECSGHWLGLRRGFRDDVMYWDDLVRCLGNVPVME